LRDFSIVGGWIDDVDRVESPNHGGVLVPDLIIMHYTAGASAQSTAEWFQNTTPGKRRSAHVVIGRDGRVVQCVDFRHQAWHAGLGSWRGRGNCNRYSVGIELANWGHLQIADGGYVSHVGTPVGADRVTWAPHKLTGDLESPWERFTNAQLIAALDVCRALLMVCPSISDIVGHDDVDPERKRDPGPLFPLATFRCLLFGKRE